MHSEKEDRANAGVVSTLAGMHRTGPFHSVTAKSSSASVVRSPLQLGAPQDVLLPVHQHGEVLVFPLFDGVGASSDGAHLSKLRDNRRVVSLAQNTCT